MVVSAIFTSTRGLLNKEVQGGNGQIVVEEYVLRRAVRSRQRLEVGLAERANKVAAQCPGAIRLLRDVNHTGKHGALEVTVAGLQLDAQQGAVGDLLLD